MANGGERGGVKEDSEGIWDLVACICEGNDLGEKPRGCSFFSLYSLQILDEAGRKYDGLLMNEELIYFIEQFI